MAEENSQENKEIVVSEITPIEQEARNMGWVPEEEYHGDPEKWLPADEFARRKPLFDKIEKQNRELKNIKETLEQFKQHHNNVRETEYKRALATLKAQKRDAFTEGDPDKIIEIDEQIDAVKQAQQQFKIEQTEQVRQEAKEIHPEFEAWTNRNAWYVNEPHMKVFADKVGLELAKNGMSPQEVLKEVEKRVKGEFPTRFKNPNREKPGSVESSAKGGSSGSGSGYTPTDFERRVARKFVEQKLFKTEADYYKELQANNNGKS